MNSALEILKHTPPFVWVIALLVCARAALSLRARWMSLLRLFIVPVIFIIGGIAGVSLRSSDNLLSWAVLAFVMVPAGFFTAPRPLAIDRSKGRLQLPRSIPSAIRVPVIFIIRYALAVALALHPEHTAELQFATSLFSGAVVGYYLGWSIGLLQTYYLTPKPLATNGL
jgi:hypothetical protein